MSINMQSTAVLPITPSELLNQLRTRAHSTFEKFVRQLLRCDYEANLLEGVLKDKTLIEEKNKELYVLNNSTKEKLECVMHLKQNMETTCNEYEIEIDQISEDKQSIEQEINLLEKKMSDNCKNLKKVHKKLLQKLVSFKTTIACYLDFDKSDPAVFTLHFFTEKRSSNDNWTVKMHQQDGSIELIHTIPELPRKDEIAAHLTATGDLQGFMYCVYQNFRALQSNSS